MRRVVRTGDLDAEHLAAAGGAAEPTLLRRCARQVVIGHKHHHRALNRYREAEAAQTYTRWHVESSRGVRGMSVSDEPENQGVPLSDRSTVWLPSTLPSDELEGIEPDEIVVRVTDDCAIVFATPNETKHSLWGRWLAKPTTSELKSLLQTLDPVARAVIEAKRLTGAVVELHPADREMFKSGFKAISEEGGWLQANFRDHGQVARLMRIRPATGVAVMPGGALALAAIAAQAQAAEMARDIKAIGQRVDQLYEHLQDDQIGAVEHAVEQVEELVGLLRAHGKDGVSESDVSVVRNALGDASSKCMQHLKTAVKNLENANQGSTRQAEQILSEGALEEVMLYLDLVGRLDVATVQFGLAQIAFDCHAGKPHVANTRAEQITRSIDKFRHEIEDVCVRLAQLDQGVRAQFLPWWKRAGKEIAASAVAGAGGGAVLAVAPAAAEAVKDGGGGGASNNDEGTKIGAAAAVGAVVGLAGGLVWGTKNTVHEVRAKKPLEERLGRLTAAGSRSLGTPGETTPILEWLHVLTRELVGPGG